MGFLRQTLRFLLRRAFLLQDFFSFVILSYGQKFCWEKNCWIWIVGNLYMCEHLIFRYYNHKCEYQWNGHFFQLTYPSKRYHAHMKQNQFSIASLAYFSNATSTMNVANAFTQALASENHKIFYDQLEMVMRNIFIKKIKIMDWIFCLNDRWEDHLI